MLAAELVVEHRDTWAGRHHDALVPAAEALEHDHPVAATVLYRALLDDILAVRGHPLTAMLRVTSPGWPTSSPKDSRRPA